MKAAAKTGGDLCDCGCGQHKPVVHVCRGCSVRRATRGAFILPRGWMKAEPGAFCPKCQKARSRMGVVP